MMIKSVRSNKKSSIPPGEENPGGILDFFCAVRNPVQIRIKVAPGLRPLGLDSSSKFGDGTLLKSWKNNSLRQTILEKKGKSINGTRKTQISNWPTSQT